MNSPQILVAVDVSEGKVVRLVRGEIAQKTIYRDDPVVTAQEWEEQGAQWLHLVDLDAAMGTGNNIDAIKSVVGAVSIPAEVGGGVRSLDAISSWIEAGAARVVIGTRAADPEFLEKAVEQFGDRVVASVDVKDGLVRLQGWTQTSGMSATDAVAALESAGVARIIFTDVSRDGTLEGIDAALVETVVDHARVPVIAGGGIATDEDVRKLAHLTSKGLEGIIVGRALYSGTLTLDAARRAAAGE